MCVSVCHVAGLHNPRVCPARPVGGRTTQPVRSDTQKQNTREKNDGLLPLSALSSLLSPLNLSCPEPVLPKDSAPSLSWERIALFLRIETKKKTKEEEREPTLNKGRRFDSSSVCVCACESRLAIFSHYTLHWVRKTYLFCTICI